MKELFNVFDETFNEMDKLFEELTDDEQLRERNNLFYKSWRDDILLKGGNRCMRCGYSIKGKLHAHHKKRFATNKNERFDVLNGELLCKQCHYKEHQGDRNDVGLFNNIHL